MNTKMVCKRLDFTIGDVNEIYEGPVGRLWELLMGEEIHVGGEKETDLLAERAGIKKTSSVLDVCSALGGPARHLARKYGCRVTGLDATGKMADKECEELNTFMVFPYMETLDGYEEILRDKGFKIIEKKDLSRDFVGHCHLYQNKLRNELKESIISNYGHELYQAADDGLNKWVMAADDGKVGRARLIGKKM